MVNKLRSLIGKEKVCILGFGTEGQSSYRLLQKIFPAGQIMIADKNPALAEHPLLKGTQVHIQSGDQYLQGLEDCPLIIKTPGIPFSSLAHIPEDRISSQAELFICHYGQQIIGITGTKGKSTTVSLIYHIIKQQTENVLLVGNIGIPPFDLLDKIDTDTIIVYELSSHQLEHIKYSPHTSLLLNLYEEHLDHYASKEDYFLAKMNIALHQVTGDTFIYNVADQETAGLISRMKFEGNLLPVSMDKMEGACCFLEGDQLVFQYADGVQSRYNAHLDCALMGRHNTMNIMFALSACTLNNIWDDAIDKGIRTFKPLAHRMQYVGTFSGIRYYNDSISTIPEATIAAVNSIPDIGTLILGGYDRGIDYRGLADFLVQAGIDQLIFLGAAGKRMMGLMKQKAPEGPACYLAESLEEAVALAKKQTAPGKVCLLSPAAASYDMFKNFEERGAVFMQLVSS